MKINPIDYLKNPCGSLSIPYWKHKTFIVPKNIDIYHDKDFDKHQRNYLRIDKYFRILNNLSSIPKKENDVLDIEMNSDVHALVSMINDSYANEHINVTEAEVRAWTKHQTFQPYLWVKITINGKMVASGIAEFDREIKEGIIEWVQVLPKHRNKGYGQRIVNELVYRLAKVADFVTVSGKFDSESNPLRLYQRCGFRGDDIWYICYRETVS